MSCLVCLGSGSANLVSYSFFSSYIPRSGYIQYQYKEVTTPPGGAPEVWEETLLTGIRISVRQSGVCGVHVTTDHALAFLGED